MKHKFFGIKCVIYIGIILIIAALLFMIGNIKDDYTAGKNSQEVLDIIEEQQAEVQAEDETEEEEPAETGDEETEGSEEVVETEESEEPADESTSTSSTVVVNDYEYMGVLEIPSLDLKLPVINEASYAALKIAPVRSNGSLQDNNLIICAHNYSSHFGNIKNLQTGAAVTITDMQGNIYNYEVTGIEIIAGTDTEAMGSGDWDLTLYTCTTDSKSRVTVRCKLVAE